MARNLETTLATLKSISKEFPNYNFVYPVHLNPNVQIPVNEILKDMPNIYLLKPLDYLSFIYLMSKCYFIMSDSGGIQEECYTFKKPIIVMRDLTERQEAINAGYAFLVGSNDMKIKRSFRFIDNKLKSKYNFFRTKNPFGDGNSSKKIVRLVLKYLGSSNN